MKKCYVVFYSNLADHYAEEVYLNKEQAEARAKDLNDHNKTIDGDILNLPMKADIHNRPSVQGHPNEYVVEERPLFE